MGPLCLGNWSLSLFCGAQPGLWSLGPTTPPMPTSDATPPSPTFPRFQWASCCDIANYPSKYPSKQTYAQHRAVACFLLLPHSTPDSSFGTSRRTPATDSQWLPTSRPPSRPTPPRPEDRSETHDVCFFPGFCCSAPAWWPSRPSMTSPSRASR